jgi:choline dehydrogenase-like flavoprotein
VPEADLKTVYDAIVVGSGAAGGMAVHVLTSHGMKVLLIEAGKQLNLEQELQSMRWPYDHPRRGRIPADHYALSAGDYRQQPPYGRGRRFSRYNTVHSYVQGGCSSDYGKNIVVNEKEHPYTGTPYAWVRARCVGGKSNIWGRLALRLSDYDFKAASRDGHGEDWPISYRDIEPYYDKVDLYLGISGVNENLPQPARQHLPEADQAQLRRGEAAAVARQDGPRADALPRRRDDRRAPAQQVPQPLLWTRRLQPAQRRLRHSRRLRLAHGTDCAGDGHRQPHAARQRRGIRGAGQQRHGQGARGDVAPHRRCITTIFSSVISCTAYFGPSLPKPLSLTPP